jgi:transcriptional regulator with XRE-family HTH domain
MSYQIKLDKRSRKAARFISRLQLAIQTAFVESGLTQQQVAERLNVDRSVINRRVKGKANLTARSIADFAFVFEKDIHFRFVNDADINADIEKWLKQPVSVINSSPIVLSVNTTSETPHSQIQISTTPSIMRVEA